MVLLSRIAAGGIATDERVVAFSSREAAESELQQLLLADQQQYSSVVLVKLFDWKKLIATLRDFASLIPGAKLPNPAEAITLSITLLKKAEAQAAIAAKFQAQLSDLFIQSKQTNDTTQLEERTGKAIAYFAKAIIEELLQPLETHKAALKKGVKLKKYPEEVAATMGFIRQHLQKIITASYGDIVFCKDTTAYQQYIGEKSSPVPEKKAPREKPVKGTTQRESLALFRTGKDMAAIAKHRNLAESTVAAHLGQFIRTGELDVYEVLGTQTTDTILPVVKELGGHALTPIKDKLGDRFSFADIRMVLNYWHWLQEQNG